MIIRQIRSQKIPAIFLENISDRRLLDQIAKETGAKISGALYSDALSEPTGPAGTYPDMFRHNIRMLVARKTRKPRGLSCRFVRCNLRTGFSAINANQEGRGP
jgi:Zinc-uptake complex component A periplasmic